jgi:ABC-type multidrug transport system fused ATPase/permease subunit
VAAGAGTSGQLKCDCEMKTILRLIVFVKKQWAWLTLAFICLALGTAFSLIVPRMLGTGIDTALRVTESAFFWWQMPRETSIWLVAGTVIIASALRGLAEYGQTFLSQTVSQKTSYDIRNAIYERLQRLSFAYHDQAQTGQLMSRATVDVEAIRMFFSMGILGIAQLVIMLVAISCILFIMNWQLALLTLAFIPLIAWRTIVFSNRLRPIWLKIQQLMATLGTILEESLTGVRIVKAFSRQKEENRKFSDQATLLYNEHIGVARQMAFNLPLMLFLMGLPTVLILWYGGRQVVAGVMTPGDLTAFILYVSMLVMPVRRLGMMANVYSRTVSAGQRILEILDTESAVKERPGATEIGKVEGKVAFEGVSFSYDSMSPTLNNVSFSVEPGNLVALLGGSGSGKSTIANLLPRFYDVTAGRITIDNTDIRDMTIASLRRNVGIAQQDIFLFSGTIKDNISYGAVNASMEQIVAVAKAAHLHDFIESLPDGYNTWVGERGLTLSGGEKQRLAIARTLLINPSILILDDSMSSVDAETEHLIRQALNRLIKGRTTFIITHRLPIIKNADLILMLKDGQLVEKGKHSELMAANGLYHQVYQSQLLVDNES